MNEGRKYQYTDDGCYTPFSFDKGFNHTIVRPLVYKGAIEWFYMILLTSPILTHIEMWVIMGELHIPCPYYGSNSP